jgi:uncharacterized protein (DUF1697 family)
VARTIAFLRAINVGGRVVKMEELRRLFESFGCENVETFIASGNVIFDSPRDSERALAVLIESGLQRALGYEVKTFLRSDAEVARIAAQDPSGSGEGTLFIAFLAAAPSPAAKAKLLGAQTDVDEFHVDGREVYWHCRVRSSDSKVSGAKLEKVLGMSATLRNVNTVRRLAAKYPAK